MIEKVTQTHGASMKETVKGCTDSLKVSARTKVCETALCYRSVKCGVNISATVLLAKKRLHVLKTKSLIPDFVKKTAVGRATCAA